MPELRTYRVNFDGPLTAQYEVQAVNHNTALWAASRMLQQEHGVFLPADGWTWHIEETVI